MEEARKESADVRKFSGMGSWGWGWSWSCTYEINSANVELAPRKRVYAETCSRCGFGSQLIDFPCESGAHG